MDEEKEPDAPEFADWGKLRSFLRGEVRTQVGSAIGNATAALKADLKAHDLRLSMLDSSVKSIEKTVNEGGWSIAHITGMLGGFIGTKDNVGQFDIAINAVKVHAERANKLAHDVRDNLQTVILQIGEVKTHVDVIEARQQGVDTTEARFKQRDEQRTEKRSNLAKWIIGIGATGGLGKWIIKHFF